MHIKKRKTRKKRLLYKLYIDYFFYSLDLRARRQQAQHFHQTTCRNVLVRVVFFVKVGLSIQAFNLYFVRCVRILVFTVAHLGDCTVMRPCPCFGHVYFPHRGLKGLSMFDSHRVRGDQRRELVVGVVGHVFFCCERDSGRVGNVRVANNAHHRLCDLFLIR